MGVAVEVGDGAGCAASRRGIGSVRLRAMASCSMQALSCGGCDCLTDLGQCRCSSSPSRKRAADDEDDAEAASAIKSKFGHGTAVPYKKRKLKKTVKFSASSHFRIVECVPGEWCDSSTDEEDSSSISASPHAASCAGASAAREEVGSNGEALCSAHTPSSSASQADADVSSISSWRSPDVLRERKIVTKAGDGPSMIGLICNALIMGLVDRSITSAETALEAIRVVVHASQTPANPASSGEESAEGGLMIEDDVFEAVLVRLQQLVEHLDRHDKVGLLPSTARLGKAFIPALKCLQGTLRVAAKEQCADGVRKEDENDDGAEHIPTPKTPTRGDYLEEEVEGRGGSEQSGHDDAPSPSALCF